MRWPVFQGHWRAYAASCDDFELAKHLFKWSRCSTAIGVAALRFSRPRGGETFLMLRNKEPELAENIDSSFEWFDLVFYRVIFGFGSRHLILVHWLQAP